MEGFADLRIIHGELNDRVRHKASPAPFAVQHRFDERRVVVGNPGPTGRIAVQARDRLSRHGRHVALQSLDEEAVLVTEGGVDAARVEPGDPADLLHASPVIAPLPEDVHRAFKHRIAVKVSYSAHGF